MVRFAQNQRGFTLIEMSIVLVIIGLIVGGILKGQELIESSRQKNAISQIDRIRAAVTTFQDRYRDYPGDFVNTGDVLGAANAGNGDGVVGALQTNLAGLLTVNGATGEYMLFFNQLAAADLLGGSGVMDPGGAAANFAGAGTVSPLPSSAFPSSGLTLAYGTHQGGTVAQGGTYNWLRMHKFVAGTIAATHAIVSPQRAFQLDQKYDDGIPMGGSIRSAGVGTGCGTAGADNEYTVATTTIQCVLFFQLN